MNCQPLFDCHTHPDLFSIKEWRRLIVAAQLKGVQGCIAAGVWWDRLEPLLSNYREWIVAKCARSEDFHAFFQADSAYPVLASVGLHPMEVAKRWRQADGCFDAIRASADCQSMREVALRFRTFMWAVGETGFDLASDSCEAWESKEELLRAQTYAFQSCAALAHELELPLIVHSRSAWAHTKNQLTKVVKSNSLRFMIHCFPGSGADAKWLAQQGGFASFGGVLTWRKARRMREALVKIPSDCVLFETDAPDLAPELQGGYRPSRNEPQFLELVFRDAAILKGCSESQLATMNMSNLMRFLGLSSF